MFAVLFYVLAAGTAAMAAAGLVALLVTSPGRAMGGVTRLLRGRFASAGAGRPPAPASGPAPFCPRCNVEMVPRTARRGPRAGEDFWGCRNYPSCKQTFFSTYNAPV